MEGTTDNSILRLTYRTAFMIAAFLISGAVNLTLIYTDLYDLHDTIQQHYDRVDRKDKLLQEQIDELKTKLNEEG